MVVDWIAQEVEDYFAASPIGLLELTRVANATDHPVSGPLRDALATVPEDALTAVLLDSTFQAWNRLVDETGRVSAARERAVEKELRTRIDHRRRACLLMQHDTKRPAPYDEPELADLTVSEDCLVPLSQFVVRESVLIRNGRAYVVMPPTRSPNSSYWLTRALFSKALSDHAWVRLDPLIRGPASEFPVLALKMLWYGPPLLWKDIEGIREEKFGRWAPGPLNSAGQFTDFAWVPKDDELHLFLEEVPKPEEWDVVGSRYFHVIFSRTTQRVIHLDGANRMYQPQELAARKDQHVHRAGKVGARVKVFRMDPPILPDAVSILGSNFFVWNYDVGHFFDPSVPEYLLGHTS
ncbi:MAG: hypothetical protein ACYC4D_10090 [Thermoleophilia bacterium]